MCGEYTRWQGFRAVGINLCVTYSMVQNSFKPEMFMIHILALSTASEISFK